MRCVHPDSAGQPVRAAGARPGPGFRQLHERRKPLSGAGGRLHPGDPAQTEGRQEQREFTVQSDECPPK